jgi:hypothetical protein
MIKPNSLVVFPQEGHVNSFFLGGMWDIISVAKLNRAYRTEILSTGMIKPNSLVVFPHEGYVNKVWGRGDIISVAKLNGAYRAEILSTGMIKPN